MLTYNEGTNISKFYFSKLYLIKEGKKLIISEHKALKLNLCFVWFSCRLGLSLSLGKTDVLHLVEE